jgi:hypothetical protein
VRVHVKEQTPRFFSHNTTKHYTGFLSLRDEGDVLKAQMIECSSVHKHYIAMMHILWRAKEAKIAGNYHEPLWKTL